MFYGNREDQNKHISEIIKENREAAQLFPEIRKVIQNFDGKVYNIRFQKALQDATGKYIWAKYNDYGSYGGNVSIYICGNANRIYTLATIRREDMKDGKRIDAEKMIASARVNRESHLKKAYKMEQSMQQIDVIKKQIQDIEQLLKAVTSPLDYEIRDTYNIPSRLT